MIGGGIWEGAPGRGCLDPAGPRGGSCRSSSLHGAGRAASREPGRPGATNVEAARLRVAARAVVLADVQLHRRLACAAESAQRAGRVQRAGHVVLLTVDASRLRWSRGARAMAVRWRPRRCAVPGDQGEGPDSRPRISWPADSGQARRSPCPPTGFRGGSRRTRTGSSLTRPISSPGRTSPGRARCPASRSRRQPEPAGVQGVCRARIRRAGLDLLLYARRSCSPGLSACSWSCAARILDCVADLPGHLRPGGSDGRLAGCCSRSSTCRFAGYSASPSWRSAGTWPRMLSCWHSGTRTRCCGGRSGGYGTSRPTGCGSPRWRS